MCVQTNISILTAKKLDKWAADIWLLSPPCQPYTRRGLKKQSADARATSFLTVLELIPQLKVGPTFELGSKEGRWSAVLDALCSNVLQ